MAEYKCIGLHESMVQGWGHRFTEGEIYKECPNTEGLDTLGMLKLFPSPGGDPFYVDADQFKEVKGLAKAGLSIKRLLKKI